MDIELSFLPLGDSIISVSDGKSSAAPCHFISLSSPHGRDFPPPWKGWNENILPTY